MTPEEQKQKEATEKAAAESDRAKFVDKVYKAHQNELELKAQAKELLEKIKEAEVRKRHLREKKKKYGYFSEDQMQKIRFFFRGSPLPDIKIYGAEEEANYKYSHNRGHRNSTNNSRGRGGHRGHRGRLF
jgi:hypothetical protein